MAEPLVTFASLLRKLRREAGLTQEELAEAASVGLRSVSYLERGRVTIPQKDTVRLLADALHLIGPGWAEFEAAARGRAAPGGVVGIHAIGGMAVVGKTALNDR
jgi:transcriptional regulator with XRE-family HTH domain